MKSEFLFSSAMDNECINMVYDIHEIVYYSKGIGLEKDVWKGNQKKHYHSISEKMIQLFYSGDDKHIIGYNIFTKPFAINDSLWSKIIEGGVITSDNSKNSKYFLLMYQDFLNWDKSVNYLGETSISSNGVTSLLIKSGFKIATVNREFESLLRFFLDSTNFTCSNKDGKCVVNRETTISKNYEAFVLLYKPNI